MNYIADILTRKPQLGFISSLLSMSLTHLQILQIIGAVLGIVIAVITAVLKVIELKEKLEAKRDERDIKLNSGQRRAPAKKKPQVNSPEE